MKNTLFILALFIGFSFAFQNNGVENHTNDTLKHLQVKITGMTCEIGCAKTIESKISKMEGVKFSKVIFAKSIGQFSFDPKVTTSEKIIGKINGIGGGNLYKVVDSKLVTGFDK
jgi:mercuric ion binding protein